MGHRRYSSPGIRRITYDFHEFIDFLQGFLKGNLGPRRSWKVLGGHGKPKEIIGCILPFDIGAIQALEFEGLPMISLNF